MMTIGQLSLGEAATRAAGNWKRFESFVWARRHDLDDSDAWAVVETHDRDSRLLDLSNSQAIAGALNRFTGGDDPDVVLERLLHWAVGHTDGFSVRVYRSVEITKAFRAYHDLARRLAECPILDESDYGERLYLATVENIADAARRLTGEYDLPDGWEGDVYSWFSEHRQRAVETWNDRGACPDEDDLRAAFEAIGYELLED